MCEQEGIAKPPKDLKILMCPQKFAGFGSCALMVRRYDLGGGEGSLRRLLKDMVKTLEPKYGWASDLLATVFDTNGPDLMIDTYTYRGAVETFENIYLW